MSGSDCLTEVSSVFPSHSVCLVARSLAHGSRQSMLILSLLLSVPLSVSQASGPSCGPSPPSGGGSGQYFQKSSTVVFRRRGYMTSAEQAIQRRQYQPKSKSRAVLVVDRARPGEEEEDGEGVVGLEDDELNVVDIDSDEDELLD